MTPRTLEAELRVLEKRLAMPAPRAGRHYRRFRGNVRHHKSKKIKSLGEGRAFGRGLNQCRIREARLVRVVFRVPTGNSEASELCDAA
jgi:hypothetical protein